MIKGIHHVAISSPNMRKLADFYITHFGFKEVFSFDWETGYDYAKDILEIEDSAAEAIILKLGNFHLELFQFSEPTPVAKPDNWRLCDHGQTHMCFEVDNCQLEYQRLKNAGMRFHCEPKLDSHGGYLVYGRDPDNNVVEIWAPGNPDVRRA